MSEPYKIYTLHDPDTMAVRYVGFTSKTLEKRLSGHINESKRKRNHKAKWVRSLLAIGKKPLILLVEIVTAENWKDREMFWIAHFRKTKCRLTNSCDGGEGALNPPDDVREKIGAAQRVRKTAEHRRKISAARMGISLSIETRSKISESKRKPLKHADTGVIYDCYRSAALSLGVSESTIWRLIRSGGLNHVLR